MALTLTIVDQADGTGATATIAGSSAGTVTVYTQAFAGDLGAGTWVNSGNRSGNGTVDLVLDTGHYFAYAVEGAAVSPVVYFTVTDGVAAVQQRIDEAVQARIRLVGLSIANDDIVVREVPTDRNLPVHPCIVISPQRAAMNPAAGVLHMDDVIYSERVSIFADDNQSQDNGGTYKLWIEKIARAFRNQRLTGVAEVFTCEVVPGPTIPPLDWLGNKYVGELILKFTARETRGL